MSRFTTIIFSASFVFVLFLAGVSDVRASLIIQRPVYIGLTSGLVGYWTFDGQDTDATVAYDKSNNNNNGTLTNGPVRAIGRIGQALKFDGVNDYIDIGTGPASVKTVAFWVYPVTTTEFFINITGTTDYVAASNGTIAATGFSSPTIYVDGAVSSTLVAGRWQHIAVVSDTAENASNLDIGRVQDASYMEGQIDDVRIYNRALNASEVRRLYRIGATEKKVKAEAAEQAAAITAVLLTSDNTTTDASSFTTASITPSPNALLLLGVVNREGSGVADVPAASGNGLTWVLVKTNTFNAATARRMTLFRAMERNPSSGAVTISFAGSQADVAWIISEFRNVDTSGTNGSGAIVHNRQEQFAAATSIDMVLNNFASRANRPAGIVGTSLDTGITPGTGYTELADEALTTPNLQMNMQWDPNNARRSFTASFDNSANNAIAVEIRPRQTATKINASALGQVTSGLVGYWTFDGPDMNATQARDLSLNANHGTLTNGPVRAIGRIGQALNFDGVNDYVDAGSPALFDNMNDFTISAWIKADTIGENDRGFIVSKGSGIGGTSPTGWAFTVCNDIVTSCSGINNTLGFVSGYGGSVGSWHTGSNSIQLGSWQHVAVVRTNNETAGSDPILYIDGVNKTVRVQVGGGASSDESAANLIIGDTITTVSRNFDGLIDDVRIYNRALNEAEVLRLYRMGR